MSDRLRAAHSFGFDGVSVPGRWLGRYLPGLRECFRDRPLPIDAISLGFEGSLVSPDPTDRERCRSSLLRLFDLCAELDAGLVNVPPVLIQDNLRRLKSTPQQDLLLTQQLPELGDAARGRGVLLLLEPVNRYESEYLNTLAHAAVVCEAVGHAHVGLTADLFHMQIEELSTPEALRQAGPWLRHVHVAENTRVEPGAGSMDFQAAFHALKDAHYAGMIELECRTLSGPAEEVLPRAVTYLRERWEAA